VKGQSDTGMVKEWNIGKRGVGTRFIIHEADIPYNGRSKGVEIDVSAVFEGVKATRGRRLAATLSRHLKTGDKSMGLKVEMSNSRKS